MNVKRLCALPLVLLLAACLPSLVNEGTDTSLAARPATPTVEPTRAARPASPTAGPTLAAQPAAPAADQNTHLPDVRHDSTPTPTRTPTPTPTRTPVPPSGGGIVADHSVVGQFAQIPKSAIDAAAAKKTLFMHQSTGGLIEWSGLDCLAGLRGWDGWPAECLTYANNRTNNTWPWYDRSKWAWDDWPEAQADAIAKTNQFVDVVNQRAGSYQVIGMKFCYVDGWNQDENVAYNNNHGYYITKMEELESRYPGKTFIWATSALWGEADATCVSGSFPSCLNIHQFNEQVRAYAHAHNKPLYDIADIESHDQNGNPCTVQGYEGMCANWYDSGGGHPNTQGSIRLAKGFWWLMARIGGWGGTSSSKP